MTQVSDIVELADEVSVRGEGRRKVVLRDEHLALARIVYDPGEGNDFHWHDGTSQALFVAEGRFMVRTRNEDGSVSEHVIEQGQCALVADKERESFVNPGPGRAVVFQVLRPGIEVVRD